jgi:hypothetical protein
MRAYLRTSEIERRTLLMAQWARFLSGTNTVREFSRGDHEPRAESASNIKPSVGDTLSVA